MSLLQKTSVMFQLLLFLVSAGLFVGCCSSVLIRIAPACGVSLFFVFLWWWRSFWWCHLCLTVGPISPASSATWAVRFVQTFIQWYLLLMWVLLSQYLVIVSFIPLLPLPPLFPRDSYELLLQHSLSVQSSQSWMLGYFPSLNFVQFCM